MGLTEPQVLPVNWQTPIAVGVTGTGTTKSQRFVTPPIGGDIELEFQGVNKSGVTGLTISVEKSPDGGTTWETHTSGLDLNTGPKRMAIGGNSLCRINVTTFTGTSADVAVTASRLA